MRLDQLNALDEPAAARVFLRGCGSSRWAQRMATSRPFANVDAMSAHADAIWALLDRQDWLEAFAAHPKIGETRSGGSGGSSGSGASGGWAQQEQASVAGAAGRTRQRLAEANRAYEVRFGYMFIVCATGKTADEMLALLERRLRHDAHEELPIAVEEQRQITQLRLKKLLEQELDTTL